MSELTNFEKIRRLKWQIFANLANVVFCYTTFFGSVFILFLSELGFDKSKIGFLLSLFPFCGLTAIFTSTLIARAGFKRVFLLFFGLRVIFVIAILPTPWVLTQFGIQLTFVWVAVVILSYALCKAIAETAYFPWQHEIIPDFIRGKFSAINTITSMTCSILTTMAVGYVVGTYAGLNRYIVIMAAGVVGGFLSVWWFSFCPGGAPVRADHGDSTHFKDLLDSTRDGHFALFTLGLFVITVSLAFATAFVPLYMKEQIGLSTRVIVWMDIAVYTGSLISGYLWGWASDRYGSKPVMVLGPLMLLFYPLLCLLLPRQSVWSAPLAFGLTFAQGLGMLAWGIGSTRYLFVTVVPAEKKTTYLAIYYATVGLAGGLGPLLAGKLLQVISLNSFYGFQIDAYAIVFALGMGGLAIGLCLLHLCPAKGDMPLTKFLGLFFHGNPILAVIAMLYSHFAKTERARIKAIHLVRRANNLINNRELLLALQDPSFCVRFETISALIHRRPDPILTQALIDLVERADPELAPYAALALANVGTSEAVEALRRALSSAHSSLRTNSARALAQLNDAQSIVKILDLFTKEHQPEMKAGYAVALARLGCIQSCQDILIFLGTLEDSPARSKTALALAMLAGSEAEYVSLLKQIGSDHSIGLASAVLRLKKHIASFKEYAHLTAMAEDAADAYAHSDTIKGNNLLAAILKKISHGHSSHHISLIADECVSRLASDEKAPIEYTSLALFIMRIALNETRFIVKTANDSSNCAVIH